MNKNTYIYIIGNNKGFIKVGLSKDPQKRIKQLQTGNGDKLSLIFQECFECNRKKVFKIEKMIHRSLSSLCSKKEGEWFLLNSENIDRVKNTITWHRIRYDE